MLSSGELKRKGLQHKPIRRSCVGLSPTRRSAPARNKRLTETRRQCLSESNSMGCVQKAATQCMHFFFQSGYRISSNALQMQIGLSDEAGKRLKPLVGGPRYIAWSTSLSVFDWFCEKYR